MALSPMNAYPRNRPKIVARGLPVAFGNDLYSFWEIGGTVGLSGIQGSVCVVLVNSRFSIRGRNASYK